MGSSLNSGPVLGVLFLDKGAVDLEKGPQFGELPILRSPPSFSTGLLKYDRSIIQLDPTGRALQIRPVQIRKLKSLKATSVFLIELHSSQLALAILCSQMTGGFLKDSEPYMGSNGCISCYKGC